MHNTASRQKIEPTKGPARGHGTFTEWPKTPPRGRLAPFRARTYRPQQDRPTAAGSEAGQGPDHRRLTADSAEHRQPPEDRADQGPARRHGTFTEWPKTPPRGRLAPFRARTYRPQQDRPAAARSEADRKASPQKRKKDRRNPSREMLASCASTWTNRQKENRTRKNLKRRTKKATGRKRRTKKRPKTSPPARERKSRALAETGGQKAERRTKPSRWAGALPPHPRAGGA